MFEHVFYSSPTRCCLKIFLTFQGINFRYKCRIIDKFVWNIWFSRFIIAFVIANKSSFQVWCKTQIELSIFETLKDIEVVHLGGLRSCKLNVAGLTRLERATSSVQKPLCFQKAWTISSSLIRSQV